MDPVTEVKVRAEQLQRRIEQGDVGALARVQRVGRAQTAEPLVASAVRYKHCLSAIARELGFADYAHLLRVVDGDPAETDFGTVPCGRPSGYLNAWFREYAEAREQQRHSGGYLLAYRRHFVVVHSPYVQDVLGIDPQDPDWQAIGFDWVRPSDPMARRRLYGKLFAQAGSGSSAPLRATSKDGRT